jgi:hypothetical protein
MQAADLTVLDKFRSCVLDVETIERTLACHRSYPAAPPEAGRWRATWPDAGANARGGLPGWPPLAFVGARPSARALPIARSTTASPALRVSRQLSLAAALARV